MRNLEDAIFGGYLTRQEVDILQQAEKTYARILNLLRLLTGRSTSTLSFEQQERLADKLGYQARSGFLPVESFMQSVYQLFHGVAAVSQEFWERLRESREDPEEQGSRCRGLRKPASSCAPGVSMSRPIATPPRPPSSFTSLRWRQQPANRWQTLRGSGFGTIAMSWMRRRVTPWCATACLN